VQSNPPELQQRVLGLAELQHICKVSYDYGGGGDDDDDDDNNNNNYYYYYYYLRIQSPYKLQTRRIGASQE
jgi:hypothetical protein